MFIEYGWVFNNSEYYASKSYNSNVFFKNKIWFKSCICNAFLSTVDKSLYVSQSHIINQLTLILQEFRIR
jgi:hypothetical protein